MKDNFSNIKKVQCVAPQALTTSDIDGDGIDLEGYHSATLDVAFASMSGNDSSNFVALKIEESDDDITYSAVDPAELVGLPENTSSLTNGIWKSLGSASTSGTLGELGNAIYSIGYIGMKRYIRVVIDVTGTLSTIVASNAILGHASQAPATDRHSVISVDS